MHSHMSPEKISNACANLQLELNLRPLSHLKETQVYLAIHPARTAAPELREAWEELDS
jgi:hypothetical protein